MAIGHSARLCQVLAASPEPAIARHLPQPVVPFATPVSIPLGALDGINKYSVVCTQAHSKTFRLMPEQTCDGTLRASPAIR